MATSHVPEKRPSIGHSELDQPEQATSVPSPSTTPKSPNKTTKYLPLLFAHTAGSIALALALVFAVDHYNAIETTTSRYVDGKLHLRVSDITTLVSAGLVIVKFFTTAWASIALWRCAYELTQQPRASLTPKQLSFMARYKLPPWIRYPFSRPKGLRSWAVALVLLFAAPQQSIAPLLSGAVDWNPSSVPSNTKVAVNSTEPTATSDYWYQYVLNSYPVQRTNTLRLAAGLASMAWADTSTVSSNGTSLTGNGCRHIVNDNGVPVNSTLDDFVVPCIRVHNISWAKSISDTPNTVFNLATYYADPLSLLNDTLSKYTNPGHALLYNSSKLWDPNQSGLPDATLVSGPLSLSLLIANDWGNCTGLPINNFGDVNKIPQYKYHWALGTCFIFANVTLTAGVTTSKSSKYVTSRVIEDQTPLDQVVLRADRWVQQSFWLLPDLMSMLSSMNSTLLPTWDNIDHYAETLIRQSYLAAWDSFHRSFDTGGTEFFALTPEPRLQATVSNARVYSWLAISLLHTVGGLLLVFLLFGPGEPDVPEGTISEEAEAAKGVMDSLAELDFL